MGSFIAEVVFWFVNEQQRSDQSSIYIAALQAFRAPMTVKVIRGEVAYIILVFISNSLLTKTRE